MNRAMRLCGALLFALASTATAATDIRILFDTDRQVATGCSVDGMSGVERVVTASLELTTQAKVTSVTVRECTSGALGSPAALDAAGAVSPLDPRTGLSSTELRLPLSFLGSPIQPARVGFVLTNGSATAAILTDQDGGAIIFPGFVPRRRSENQNARHINIDGSIGDWTGPPLVSGNSDEGTAILRFLNVYASPGTDALYFRFDTQSNASAPMARNDSYSTPLATPLSVSAPGVLANDTDPNGKPLSANLVTAPAEGLLVLNADGSFSFVPDGGGASQQTFTYQATNGTQPSNVARVEIGIGTRPNHAPVAADDAYPLIAGETLTVAAPGVLKNDSDADHDPLTAHVTSQPAHGTLTFQADGSFTYANDGTAGLDSFKYRATDGFEDSNEATVQLPVSPRPSVPVFTSANATTFYIGIPASFAIGTFGLPTATITETGTLPAGIVFTPKNDGTATLSGTAVAGTAGTYILTLKATNPNGTATQTFTLTVTCPAISITNPSVATATAGAPFSQSFTASGGVGGVTFTTASVLPAGLTLATNGTLSGTPAQSGTFPVTVVATDVNGCAGAGAVYNLLVSCPSIAVTKPAVSTATAGSPFSQTFTQSGGVGATTFTTVSVLPAGLALAANGTLSGTPTQTGSFDITVTVTDANNCAASVTYMLVVGCQTISVSNPAVANGTASSAFSQTFTQTGAIGTATFSLPGGTLPAGLTLAANGTLSGTPTQTGSFPITVKVTDSNGCSGTGTTYTLVIGCQTITVTNPGSGSGVANAAFSQTFTQSGGIGAVAFSLTSGTLPAGLTLAANGTVSGTPTQIGSFPITVTATDANGCSGISGTYTIVIACPIIAVNNPATASGTVNASFSQTFTAGNAIGTVVFTTASPLPPGLTLAANGTLSGTPTQPGTFPITVTATDQNGCTGISGAYNLAIGCQIITVTNPASSTTTAGSPFSEIFTQTAAVGTATFTTASTLPAGLTLAANGTLSGTPTQIGTFPIVVTVTDSNGCTGTSASYNLIVGCPSISVTNPGTTSGTVNVAFSDTFISSGGIGAVTFSTASTLPNGLTLAANGTLSGTPLQSGTFPIVVTATDANGCTGTGATYTLVIACQTITVTNPGTANGTAGTFFSQTFTQSGGNAPQVFAVASGTLPAGLALASNGTLSGTPTQTGTFPITVSVTDGAGCSATGITYNLVIGCQTITVTNPVVTTGTAGVAFSQNFTQSSAIGTATFSLASGTLPAGLTLAANGTLSGIPTQTGAFPITVTVTDSNGCTGTGVTYNLVIGCPTITITNPSTTSGTVNAAFSQQFTQAGGVGAVTFTTVSALPGGFSLAADGTLSGTPTQPGTFPITVTATDANSCTGTSAIYNLVINCQIITVTNPAITNATVASPFSEQFTQSGGVGVTNFSTASTLPTGLSLAADGTLSGTPTQSGTFNIAVVATDSNGCSGTGVTYTLVVACNTITVTNPATDTGTAGVAFSSTFTQSGGNGTITWSETGPLPAGITLNTSTGVLSGTTNDAGTFPIAVTATDVNGCTGTGATYNLTFSCQSISITNPATTSVQAGQPLSATFTATGILGTATWSVSSGTLPSGITLDPGTGVLSGTSTQQGSFLLAIRVTDSNGCSSSSPYTLTVVCPVISVTRTGGGSFPAGNVGTAYAGQSFAASGGTAPYSFAVTSGTFPSGLTLASGGTISGTPTATGTFLFDITATDASSCTGTASFSIAIAPSAGSDSYSNLVNNTEAVVTGGTTVSPSTPFVALTGTLIANDLPSGGVAINSGTFATAQGGSVVLAADGTFKYTPPLTASALAADSFNYTITSNSGGTATPTQATGTATLSLSGRVWYVKNDGANGNGQSQSPFNTLSSFTNAGRSTPDQPGDIIFVYTGDGTSTNLNAGPPAYSLLNNEQLIGQGLNVGASGFALVVNGNNLVATGAKPKLTNSGGDVVLLANNNVVKGLELSGGTGSGIRGQTTSGFTGDTLDLLNNAGAGLNLDTMAGAIVLTNSAISGNQQYGLKINGGTASVSVDATNSVNAVTTGAGVYSVAITNHATGLIDIGATINDTGRGITISGNTSGTIQFTGTQTLNIPSNFNAVDLSTNTGATITFSGTLQATALSGASFSATGGGTLNVSGTATLAKSGGGNNVLIMNGMTVGGSGVTFATVNTSGFSPSVPVSLTNVTGTVAINGGTIGGNGLTGIALQGASTSLTLANVTINGTLTNGIKTTTNFGTLTIGSNVSVSAANALDLNNGTVTGTFTSVTATGGSAPGVNLNGVTVTTGFGTAAGSINGGNDTAFNVAGGSGAAITWGGTVNQSLGFGVVSIATNANTITFSGNVTGFNASTGIAITSSTGTYTFSGAANNITGTGASSFTINGGTASMTYNGNATEGAAFPLVAVTNHATGTLTFQSGTLTGNSSNTGLVFTNADGTYNFNGTTALSGTNSGIDVLAGSDVTNGSQGTFSFGSGASITNPGGPVIDIQASKPSFTYSGSFTKNTASVGFNAQNNQGGSITINGTGTKSLTTSTSNAIVLDNNDNCTITFSGNALVLSTTTGAAFTGTNGGIINVLGTGNTITTTTGAAVNIVNTTIGASGITFESASHNGNNTAITLNTTGAGAFTVTGTGTTAGTGGTIQNIVGSDAVVLNTTGGLVTLKNMNIQDITASTDSSDPEDTHSNVDAIHGQIVNGGLTLDKVTIQRISDNGINGTVNGAPPTATVWNGLTLTNCTFTNTNRFNTTHADANNEGAVFIKGIKGTVSVTGTAFSNAGNGMILWTDTAGTLDATIQSNSFTTLYKEIGTLSVGNFGIDLVQQGSLASIVRIGDTTNESNAALGNTFTNGGDRASIRIISNTASSGAMRSSIAKNTFIVTDHSSPGVAPGSLNYNFPQGGVLLRAMGTGNYEAIFAANVLTQVMHADGGLGQLSLLAEKGDSEFIVRNNQFNLPWDAPIELRADGAAGGQNSAKVLFTGNMYQDGIVGDGTTDLGGQAPYEGFYAQVRNNGRMDLTIQNEGPLGLTDNTSALGTFSFYARTTTAGDVLNLFLLNTLSPRGFQLNAASGTTYNLFRNGSASGTVQGVLQDNFNKGGGGVDTTVPPTVSTPGVAPVNLVGTSPALPFITQP